MVFLLLRPLLQREIHKFCIIICCHVNDITLNCLPCNILRQFVPKRHFNVFYGNKCKINDGNSVSVQKVGIYKTFGQIIDGL